jgi:segregation and condensation protein A
MPFSRSQNSITANKSAFILSFANPLGEQKSRQINLRLRSLAKSSTLSFVGERLSRKKEKRQGANRGVEIEALWHCQPTLAHSKLCDPVDGPPAEPMAEYKVKFEVFEGPLDLLLYLIKKEEVDIYEVNLTKLATQFLEYIEVMRLLDLEIAGEFLVMAATLMYIKSRELLPVDLQQTPEGEEDEGDDPRWELIRQLVEYKKFKDAAVQLQTLEFRQDQVFARIPPKTDFEAPPSQQGEASLFDLINAVNQVLKRVNQRGDARDVFEDKWTVSEKIESLMKSLLERPVLRFSDFFATATSRSEVVVTFLAVLELIRLRQLVAVQEEAFGEIEIRRATPQPVSSPPAEGTTPEGPAGSAIEGSPSPQLESAGAMPSDPAQDPLPVN